MKTLTITLTLFFFQITLLGAQKIFNSGSIELTNGAIKTGLIFSNERNVGERLIYFKTDKNSPEQSYQPSDIKSYTVGSKHYVPRQIKETYKSGKFDATQMRWQYLRQLESGSLNLYQSDGQTETWLYIKDKKDNWTRLETIRIYYDNDEHSKIAYLDTIGIVDLSEAGKYNFRKTYYLQLQELTKDCPVDIDPENTQLKPGSIRKVIQAYNKCKGDVSDRAISGGRPIQFWLSGKGAVMPSYQDNDPTNLTFAVGAEFIFLNLDERFGIGISYLPTVFYQNIINPNSGARFEYEYEIKQITIRGNFYPLAGRRLQPYGSIGFTLRKYSPSLINTFNDSFDQSVFLGVGIQWQVIDRIRLQAELSNNYFPAGKLGVGVRLF